MAQFGTELSSVRLRQNYTFPWQRRDDDITHIITNVFILYKYGTQFAQAVYSVSINNFYLTTSRGKDHFRLSRYVNIIAQPRVG